MKRQESRVSNSTDRSDKIFKNKRLFDDIRADDAERLRSLKQYDYFIILPDDSFKTKWDFIITMYVLLNINFYVYNIDVYCFLQ